MATQYLLPNMREFFSECRKRLGWLCGLSGVCALIAVLIAAVPPFLAMPPWGDVTLYDVAAREIRTGGVHYRDVFDTNPPGFVWSLAVLRSAIGPSYEVLRAIDLCIVGFICVMLSRLMGTGFARSMWFFVAAALFYPFTSEFNHIQRDVWMMLPAVLATSLRANRTMDRSFWPSVGEGILWGCAVWFKPHCIFPAAVVWLVTCRGNGKIRSIAFDLLGQFTGGLLIGAVGVFYLTLSGTWPHFLDVMLNWNPEYAGNLFDELPQRLPWNINYFGGWDLVHLAAVPLACYNLWKGGNSNRGLAALYLGWYAQAMLLQRVFPYVHLPETILALALIGQRIPVGIPVLGWFLIQPLLALIPAYAEEAQSNYFLAPHPLMEKHLYDVWPRCLREGSSAAMRNKLGQLNSSHCGTDWVQLELVADFLRTANLKDGELICWHDGTHRLYLLLNVKPGLRYMHLGTTWAFESKREAIAEEVRSKEARFVVSDLRLLSGDMTRVLAPGEGGKWYRLPAWIPESQRKCFPWNQRIVFRSGRYVVHEMGRPVGCIQASLEE